MKQKKKPKYIKVKDPSQPWKFVVYAIGLGFGIVFATKIIYLLEQIVKNTTR